MSDKGIKLNGVANKCLFAFLAFLMIAPGAAASLPAPEPAGNGEATVYQTLLEQHSGDALSIDQIAIELSNPVTWLRSVDTELELRNYQGSMPAAGDQTSAVYRIKPSFPIALSNGKTLQLRATIPIVLDNPNWVVNFGDPVWELDRDYAEFLLRQSPQVTPSTGRFKAGHGHLSDVEFGVAYGGVSDNGYIGLLGLATVLPSSQDVSASRDQFLLGPEVTFGKISPWGMVGARVKHLTDLSGDNRFHTHETTAKLFFAYGLGKGWQLVSNPEITYDWEAISGDKWLVPLGAGIAKTMRWGRMPVKLAVELQHYVISPDRFAPEWQVTFNLTPVFSGSLWQ